MKNIKKLLAALCAIAMVMGTMGTAVLAEETTFLVDDSATGGKILKMTTENAEEGIITAASCTYDSASGNFIAGTKTIWTKGTLGANDELFDVFTGAATNLGRVLNVYPGKAGLTKGFYEVYHLMRNGTTVDADFLPYYKFKFISSSEDSNAYDFRGVRNVASIGGTQTGNDWIPVGTYSYGGNPDTEYIQIGTPQLSDKNIVVGSLLFVPVTSGSVVKNYTMSKNATSLTMPIDLDVAGELSGVTYLPTSCDTTYGKMETANGFFTYTPTADAKPDSFEITATSVDGSVIKLTVNITMEDEEAIYLDDTDAVFESGADDEAEYNVSATGWGKGYKRVLRPNDAYKWSLAGKGISGVYEVYFHKPTDVEIEDAHIISVAHNGITENVEISGLNDDSQRWVSVGAFDFTGASDEFVKVTKHNPIKTYSVSVADAIKFVPLDADNDKIIEKNISVFVGQTYKGSALLTYGDSASALKPSSISVSPSNGTATLSENSVTYIHNGGTEKSDTFEVLCGEYTVIYNVSVSECPTEDITGYVGKSSVSDGVTTGGTWSGSNNSGKTSGGKYSNEKGAWIKWTIPAGTPKGYYEAKIWRYADQQYTMDAAEIEILHNKKTENFIQRGLSIPGKKKDTTNDPAGFISMGTFYFDGSGEEYIKITNMADTYGGTGYRLQFSDFMLVPCTENTDVTISEATYDRVASSDANAASGVTALRGTKADDIKVKVQIENNGSKSEGLSLITALYNNEKLVNVYTKEYYARAHSDEEVSSYITVPKAADGDDYKLRTFIWDSLAGIKPLVADSVLD